ncbi:DUF1028 domain-containing protein [Alicyclobacillus mengziensis]|uniref:DUF1028 domain-containing protein n=1 Tax=Alicyclobacillus mengziensis TaxID=2931921 RepID=A0A9X7Z6Y4_9BACL|nr:DUF1028 domain-containing protein [Alicyclobacillus mengziensis]QSO46876.1 DUF1028 domain-containing protein [Alicyclobacillus mengziensis]
MSKTPALDGLPAVATFSIVGVDTSTGEIGVAVQSKFLAVGAVVPWVSAGSGAVATQSWANTSYGPKGLELLSQGLHPEQVIERLVAADPDGETRQLGIVDMAGRSATFTGKDCFDYAGGIAGPGFAAQGNILANSAVIDGLVKGFQAEGSLPDRLLSALTLAQQAGGDKRGMQGAALYVAKAGAGYGGFNDRYIDLRVDDHSSPIEELKRLLALQRLYFGRTAPEDRLPIMGATLDEIRVLLAGHGYHPGTGSAYDAQTQSQLQAYFLTENFDDRWTDEAVIDRLVLEFMRKY